MVELSALRDKLTAGSGEPRDLRLAISGQEARPLKQVFKHRPRPRRGQIRLAAMTTEGDEVQVAVVLVAARARGHAVHPGRAE